MKSKLFLAFALITGVAAAQNVRVDRNATQSAMNAPPGASVNVMTVPNAIVSVCSYPATGTPCTNTVPIYSDIGGTQQIPQPFTADQQGRYGYWVPANIYTESIQTASGTYVGTFIITPGIGSISTSGTNGNFAVGGILTATSVSSSVNNWQNPLAFGVGSNGSANTVTATGSGTSITLSAVSDFVNKQGFMVEHGGVSCGTVLSRSCAFPPTPAATPSGTSGSTTYSYKLACIDGLGGVGAVGTAGITSTGNATLAGVVTGTVLSGNYNVVTWTGNSTCSEVAIYRNNALIASEYSAPSGTMTFNDMGLGAWTNRDIPPAPPTTALNDNYIGQITALSGTTATISPSIPSIVSATVYHSDTPLIQQAISAGSFVQLPYATYLVNYPINFTRAGSATGFNVSGSIAGPANVICDTGDICLDLTGDNNIDLADFSLTPGSVNPSPTDIFCARDTTFHSDVAQNITTRRLTLQPGGENALGGRGNVGFYNHACEIQHNYDTGFQAERWAVLTATNVDHVSSLFDATDDRSTNSMSEVEFFSATGAARVVAELDNAYSVSFYGGYSDDNFNAAHPWAFEIDAGEVGRLTVQGFRVENRGGLIDVFSGAQLNEPTINTDLYRSTTVLAGLPQIRLNGTANMINAPMVVIDDYGGSGPVFAPLVDGGTGCGVGASHLQIGLWETLGTCQTTGNANFITGANNNGDWSLPPTYLMTASPSGGWVKLGTWKYGTSIGSSLGIHFVSGTGFDPGNMDKPAIVDLTIRSGNNTSAPNLSAANILVSGTGTNPIPAAKIVATAGSTSVTNPSWDVYIQESVFANGNYSISKSPLDQWTNINSLSSDPGTGATIVAATLNTVLTTQPLVGFTGVLSGAPIAAGACFTVTASVTGATSAMSVVATPASTTQLIAGLHWDTAYISAAGVVTVPVCNLTSASITPNITPGFNVRVIQ